MGVVLVTLLALFVYVALRSGPLAPVAVTVAAVESRTLTPSLFGVGTVLGVSGTVLKIHFGGKGTKTLNAEFAPIEKI